MASDHYINIEVFGRTDVGTVRDHNEDNFLVANLSTGEKSLKPDIRNHVLGSMGSLFLVCDGMGGAAAGEIASSLAVEAIYKNMISYHDSPNRSNLAANLVDSIRHANDVILQSARENRERTGMGTTCTAASLIDDILVLAQVGDSRGYIIRKDRMYQVTKDQTLLNKLLEIGQLTPETAGQFEHNHVILQALGVKEKVDPVVSAVELAEDDCLLLCSDGLVDALTPEEILSTVLSSESTDPLTICKNLTDTACKAGANDNVTVIFVRFTGNSFGVLDKNMDVPYIEVSRNHLSTHLLMVRPPIEDSPDTTQVFGSFNLINANTNPEK
ncbi:MAG: serine/threonine-protein phosphatase [Deltaproteobacteria bacterium]|nr:serine/threonine-protein phosphatase [Deltaproteobacteria bacterium]